MFIQNIEKKIINFLLKIGEFLERLFVYTNRHFAKNV